MSRRVVGVDVQGTLGPLFCSGKIPDLTWVVNVKAEGKKSTDPLPRIIKPGEALYLAPAFSVSRPALR